MPMPFKPPQIMKFQEAPCHSPPSSIVSIALILVVIFLRFSGLKMATRAIIRASNPMPPPTHQLPERKVAIAAIIMMMQNEPKVALRLPPNGM